MISWPDFKLPPINLWNLPWQKIERVTSEKEEKGPSWNWVDYKKVFSQLTKHR